MKMVWSGARALCRFHSYCDNGRQQLGHGRDSAGGDLITEMYIMVTGITIKMDFT